MNAIVREEIVLHPATAFNAKIKWDQRIIKAEKEGNIYKSQIGLTKKITIKKFYSTEHLLMPDNLCAFL